MTQLEILKLLMKLRHLIHTYLLTELSSSCEAASCAATQELPNILWNPKVHYRVKQHPSTFPYPEPDRSSPYHPILSL
jgi:hypothetical protein